jgi:hypothetical protein
MLLRDTDGDDKADSPRSRADRLRHPRHPPRRSAPSAADPSGAFLMGEGVFLHSNVETPYGPVRGVDGGFYRFSPQRTHLERTAQLSIPNPWGIAFDDWGQDFFLHTSGTSVNWMMPGVDQADLRRQSPRPPRTSHPRATRSARPPASSSSPPATFPDEVQGDMLLCNNIGFLGIKQHKIERRWHRLQNHPPPRPPPVVRRQLPPGRS